MADFGTIAGGLGIASLAIQIADSLLKLKNFLDNVKEAPEEIKHLLSQLEALRMVLAASDTTDDQENVSAAVATSVKSCERLLIQAAAELETTVKELDVIIGKKKRMGGFKTVLKQGTIDRIRLRLRDAQSLLVLSNQYYSQ